MRDIEKIRQWQRHHIVKFMLKNDNKGSMQQLIDHFKTLGVVTNNRRYARDAFTELCGLKVLTKDGKGVYTLHPRKWFDLEESKLEVSDEVPPPHKKPRKPDKRKEEQEEPKLEISSSITRPLKGKGPPAKGLYKNLSQEACNCLEAMQRELAKGNETDAVKKLRKKCEIVLLRARELEQREIMAKTQ